MPQSCSSRAALLPPPPSACRGRGGRVGCHVPVTSPPWSAVLVLPDTRSECAFVLRVRLYECAFRSLLLEDLTKYPSTNGMIQCCQIIEILIIDAWFEMKFIYIIQGPLINCSRSFFSRHAISYPIYPPLPSNCLCLPPPPFHATSRTLLRFLSIIFLASML